MSWGHSHQRKVKAAHQLQWSNGCPCTEVLMVCDCGDVKTVTLTGHWTIAQLQPDVASAAADKKFFKDLGVKL